jgi:hypothetical protein
VAAELNPQATLVLEKKELLFGYGVSLDSDNANHGTRNDLQGGPSMLADLA